MAMVPFRTLSTTRAAGSTASGAAFGRAGHPFEAKLAELRDHHRRHTTQDHEAAYYAKKLNQEAQLEEGRDTERPPKMSDWISKEVMLPILGKNKTSLLHSPDQFEIDSISQQKHCINRPYERTQYRTLDHGGQEGKAALKYGFGGGLGFGVTASGGGRGKPGRGAPGMETTMAAGGAQRKLSEILKQ